MASYAVLHQHQQASELEALKRELSEFLFGVGYPHRPGAEKDSLWALMAVDAMVRARFAYTTEAEHRFGVRVRFSLAGELIRFEGIAESLPLAVARVIAEVRVTFQANEKQISLRDLL